MIEQVSATTYRASARGVTYQLRVDSLGRWEVWSRRDALGRSNVGTFRHYPTMVEVEQNVAAFRGLVYLVVAGLEGCPAGRC